jgi:hypothetical protein
MSATSAPLAAAGGTAAERAPLLLAVSRNSHHNQYCAIFVQHQDRFNDMSKHSEVPTCGPFCFWWTCMTVLVFAGLPLSLYLISSGRV